MKRIMICSVGEQESPVLEGFRYHSRIDRVYLLCSQETFGMAEDIRNAIEKLYREVEVIVSDASRLDVILTDLRKSVKYRVGDDVISNITGGTKIMVLALYIYTMIVGGKAFYIFRRKDGTMEYVEVPSPKLDTSPFFGLRGQRYRIARLLRERILTQHEISRELNLTDTTVKTHLEKMRTWGMIDYRYDGKRKVVYLTDIGRAMLEIYEIEKSVS